MLANTRELPAKGELGLVATAAPSSPPGENRCRHPRRIQPPWGTHRSDSPRSSSQGFGSFDRNAKDQISQVRRMTKEGCFAGSSRSLLGLPSRPLQSPMANFPFGLLDNPVAKNAAKGAPEPKQHTSESCVSFALLAHVTRLALEGQFTLYRPYL